MGDVRPCYRSIEVAGSCGFQPALPYRSASDASGERGPREGRLNRPTLLRSVRLRSFGARASCSQRWCGVGVHYGKRSTTPHCRCRLGSRPAFADLPSPNDPSPEGLWPAGRSLCFAQAGRSVARRAMARKARSPARAGGPISVHTALTSPTRRTWDRAHSGRKSRRGDFLCPAGPQMSPHERTGSAGFQPASVCRSAPSRWHPTRNPGPRTSCPPRWCRHVVRHGNRSTQPHR